MFMNSYALQMLAHVAKKVKRYGRGFACLLLLLGAVPFVMGFAMELVVQIPLRIPLDETPITSFCSSWLFGFMPTKILALCLLMTPREWAARRMIDQLQEELFAVHGGMRLSVVVNCLYVPLIWLGIGICAPYVLAHSIAPRLGEQIYCSNTSPIIFEKMIVCKFFRLIAA